MLLRSDWTTRPVVEVDRLAWAASPCVGVERRMLERDEGGELARGTSVVRYAPGSNFTAHTHGAGEEFFVLEGVFEDEHGAYPPGTYVRNPWGSYHRPFSTEGCQIFVKIRQMPEQASQRVVLNWESAPVSPQDLGLGIESRVLYRDSVEDVSFEVWAAGAARHTSVHQSEEMLLVSGDLSFTDATLGALAWVRFSAGDKARLHSPHGCRLWVKRAR